jgi:hypothetical protein
VNRRTALLALLLSAVVIPILSGCDAPAPDNKTIKENPQNKLVRQREADEDKANGRPAS